MKSVASYLTDTSRSCECYELVQVVDLVLKVTNITEYVVHVSSIFCKKIKDNRCNCPSEIKLKHGVKKTVIDSLPNSVTEVQQPS